MHGKRIIDIILIHHKTCDGLVLLNTQCADINKLYINRMVSQNNLLMLFYDSINEYDSLYMEVEAIL